MILPPPLSTTNVADLLLLRIAITYSVNRFFIFKEGF